MPKKSFLSIINRFKVNPYQEKYNEIYMNEKQLNHFKYILNTWEQQLKEKIKKSINQISNESVNFPDPIDRAVQEEEFSLKLRNSDRERKLIKKIQNTLQKIKKKSFGYCDACDIEIGIRRLEVKPTASLCIDCKKIAEIREKQMSG